MQISGCSVENLFNLFEKGTPALTPTLSPRRGRTLWACFEKTDGEVGVIWLVVLVFEVNGRMVTQGAVSALAIVEAFDVIEDFCAGLAAGDKVAAVNQF